MYIVIPAVWLALFVVRGASCGDAERFVPFPAFHAAAVDDGTEAAESMKPAITAPESLVIVPRMTVKPSTAMYHSLFVPGWGQLNNNRKMKAALFFCAETVLLGGYLYKNHVLRSGDHSAWDKEVIRTDRNTYLMYWIISKFLGMTDAYVDAQLIDFNVRDVTPEELKGK